MRPYSNDLRERVAFAVDHHEGTLTQIARCFRISLKTVRRWLQRRRQTGSLDPAPHGGGRPRAVDGPDAERLADLVRQRPDATLDELNASLGLGCSRTAIFRALGRLRISRKTKTLHASERDTPGVKRKRRDFRRKLAAVAPECLVFVDETGAHTSMTRRYGRATVGERVQGAVPGHWESVTMVAALRRSGVASPMAFAGAMDAPTFEGYVEQILVPELHPGDVVVWDNLRPHQGREVRRSIRGVGARLVFLPPHSPDLAPIEKMFSKVKEALRSIAARTTSTVYAAMDRALKTVHGADIIGWFQSCGLCPTQP
jgi:transposase